jgi:hypothetical protein
MPKKKEKQFNIKLSTTFVKRAVCKHCGLGPRYFFFIKNNTFYKNVKYAQDHFEYIRKNIKRMCVDLYLESSPSWYESTHDFKFQIPFKGYNPKFHRMRGINNNDNITECAVCDCRRTIWQFNYKSTQDRKEISMRQAPRNFPNFTF